MKNGTVYANKVKRMWQKMRPNVKDMEIPEAIEPLDCLAQGILGVSTTENRAEKAVEKLRKGVVDWNEIRVSNPDELSELVGTSLPKGHENCQRLIDALQSIYDLENCMGMDRVQSLGRRDARQYLDSLAGTDEYAVAFVMLWSLGGHAIPVNDSLLSSLVSADLVNPDADRAEVQAFLERHISAADGKLFSLAMRTFKSTSAAGGKSSRSSGKSTGRTSSRSKPRTSRKKKKTTRKSRT